MKVEDIWIQPAEGFNEENKGRTEEQIREKEALIGFKFPDLYREHLKIQNGGYLRKCAYNDKGNLYLLLYNGATFDPIDDTFYFTLKDVLVEYMNMEELASQYDFLYLDRLPILSQMDGHTMLCFDYGYKEESPFEIPEIVYFELEAAENGFEEKLRIKSYDELINNLVYYESTSYFIGIRSDEPIEGLAEKFFKTFAVKPEEKHDDRYGWYNFDTWFYSELKINDKLSIHLRITPNQFRSATFLFQNNKDCRYILDMELRAGVDYFEDNSDFIKPILEDKLNPFLTSYDWEFLLVPFNNPNPAELEKFKKAYEGSEELASEKRTTGNEGKGEFEIPTSWWRRLWS